MKSTRLNEILSSLSADEFTRLGEFLLSPYLNKNKQIVMFYHFLSAKQSHPDYSLITREEIFDYIYKGQEFSLDKYLKVSSDLVKTVERFLIQELRNGRDFINKRTILEIAGSRNLPKTFSKYLSEIESRLSDELNFNKDLDFYLAEYESRVEAMLYNINSKKFSLENELLRINHTVDLMIAHSKLELMIKLFHIPGKKDKVWFEKEVTDFVNSDPEYFRRHHPMIYLRDLILKMFLQSDPDIYKQVRTFITKNEKSIGRENLAYLYDKLMTFCSMNEGSDDNKHEEFELIRSLDKNDLIANDGVIDHMYFLKVIDTALSENDTYWAEVFLKKYEPCLDPDFRESSVNLALASIYIYRHKFDKALDHISQVASHDDYFYITSKAMSLIIFYELDDLQSVSYAVESFGTYLKRNKKQSDHASHKNFLTMFRQLLSIRNKRSRTIDKKALTGRIRSERKLLNRDWLLRKVASIEIGNKNI